MHAHSSSSTLAACEEPTPPGVVPQSLVPGQGSTAPRGAWETELTDSVEWVQLSDDATNKTCYWNRCSRATSWLPPEGIKIVWVGTLRTRRRSSTTGTRQLQGGRCRGEGLGIPHPISGATACLWQSLVRCLRVPWFVSGYVPCVSLRWLLVLSHFFFGFADSNPEVDSGTGHYSTRSWHLAATCWVRVFLAVTCLVSASPEEYKKMRCLGYDFRPTVVDTRSCVSQRSWGLHVFLDLGSRGRFRRVRN